MIRFENLTKTFKLGGTRKTVINNLTMTLPEGKSLALLGRNGAGKSTLLKMIAGSMSYDSGRIITDCSISWPVGFGGSFHRELTGAQNVRFIARIYGVDTDQLLHFVEDFSELGKHFYMPVRTYSAGMHSRLAFGASMGIRFDTYLVDETTAAGDARFAQKARAVFRKRMEESSAIMVNHNLKQVREFCDAGIVLEEGKATYFEDLDQAIEIHEYNLRLDQKR